MRGHSNDLHCLPMVRQEHSTRTTPPTGVSAAALISSKLALGRGTHSPALNLFEKLALHK